MMVISLVLIIVVLTLVLVYKEYSLYKIKNDIQYINSMLNNDSVKQVLLHTEDSSIRELLIKINFIIEKNLDEDMKRANNDELIRKSLSNISHDLKTPLTVLLGYIEIINMDRSMNEIEKNRLLLKIQEKGQDIVELINEFFTLAKLENNEERLYLGKVNLSETIKEVVVSYYEIFEKETIELQLDMSEKDIYILGDKVAVERILNNLISNALRYGKEGGIVGISLAYEDEFTIINVWDKGKGINLKDKDKVFNRLYTGDDARSRSISGSGLGLAITKQLALAMEGNITLESIPYEKTSFKVYLKRY